MGYSGVDFKPEKVDIFFESNAGKLQIVKDGTATDYSEEKAILKFFTKSCNRNSRY